MGSVMGKQLKKALAVLIAAAMALSLNPAAALATGVPVDNDTGQPQQRDTSLFDNEANGSAVSKGMSQTGSGNQMSTDVSVRVKSDFKLTVTSESTLSIDPNAGIPQDAAFTVELTKGRAPYTYELMRQIDAASEGSEADYQDDAAWKTAWDALTGKPALGDIADGKKLTLSLKDQHALAAFQPDKMYRYVLTAKDASGVALTTNLFVSTSSDYQQGTIWDTDNTQWDANAKVGATGLFLKGTLPDGITRLTAQGLPDSTLSALKRAAQGQKLDAAYQVAITNDNSAKRPFQGEVSLTFVVPDDLEPGSTMTLLTIGADGAVKSSTVKVETYENSGQTKKVVQVPNQAALGVYALAHAVPPAEQVAVTSQVGTAEDGASGQIDITGTHSYPKTETVRYTFVPDAGCYPDHVKVQSGKNESTVDLGGSNFYDLALSGYASDVTLAVYFAKQEQGSGVAISTAVSPDASGKVEWENLTAKRPAGTAFVGDMISVTVTPADGYTAASAALSYDGADHPVSLTNNAFVFTVTAETTISATFAEGTPITPEKVRADYSQTPASSECGWMVQVPADAEHKVELGKPLVLTLLQTDAAKAAGYQLTGLSINGEDVAAKMTGTGNGSNYTIPSVLGDLNIKATFGTAKVDVPITVGANGSVSVTLPGGAAQTFAAGTTGGKITGVDRTATGNATIVVTPASGYVVNTATGLDKATSSGPDAAGVMTYTISSADLAASAGIAATFRQADKDPETFEVTLGITDDGKGSGTVRTVAGGAALTDGHKLTVTEPNGLRVLVEPADKSKATVTLGNSATGTEITPDMTEDNKWVSYTFEQLKALDAANRSISVRFQTTEEEPQPVFYAISTAAQPSQGATFEVTDAQGNKLEGGKIAEGVDAKVRVIPAEGYTLQQVTLSSATPGKEDKVLTPGHGLVQSGSAYELELSAQDIKDGYTAVSAQMKADTYNVAVKVVGDKNSLAEVALPAGCSVSPTSFTSVPRGGSVSLNVTPAKGYAAYVKQETASTTGNWSSALKHSTFTIMDVKADTTVYVLFEEDSTAPDFGDEEKHYITVGSTTGGSVEPAGELIDGKNKVVVSDTRPMPFTFHPAEGSVFSYVVIDEGTPAEQSYSAADLVQTNGQFIFGRVEADHTLHAVFVPKAQVDANVRYQVSHEGEGTVSPEGTVYVPKSGTAKTVEVAPATGKKVGTITLNGQQIYPASSGAYEGDSAGGTVTLPAQLPTGMTQGSLTVAFADFDEYEMVHAQVAGQGTQLGGTITPSGDTRVALGSSQTYSFIPDQGYQLESAYLSTAAGSQGTNITSQVTGGQNGQPYTYTFTVTTETWITAAFSKVPEGGQEPPKPDTVKLRVSAVGGYADFATSEVVKGSTPTISFFPDLPSYELKQLTVNDRPVEPLPADCTITLTADQTQADVSVRAVFEEKAAQTIEVDFQADAGGAISPAGKQQVVVGGKLPISLIPGNGKKVTGLQLTYRTQGSGLPRVDTVEWSDSSYEIDAVPADLAEVRVLFGDVNVAGGEVAPVVKKRTVEVKLADGAQGSVSPTGQQTVTSTGALALTVSPKPGYAVDHVRLTTLGGQSDLTVSDGQAFVPYDKLGDGANSVEVAFKKIQSDFVDVEVSVTFNMNAGEGGSFSPSDPQTVKRDGKSPVYTVYPDDGYVVDAIEYSFVGETERHSVAFEKAGDAEGSGVTDVSRARMVGAAAGEAAQGGQPEPGVRYYTFQLDHVTGDIEVYISFRKLAEGEQDTAKVAPGTSLVTASTASSTGGFISPNPRISRPKGESYAFDVHPSTGYVTKYVTVTYADGGREVYLPADLVNGQLELAFDQDMSVYAQFERGSSLTTTQVTVALEGRGSVSPGTSFRAEVGSNQDFLFMPEDGWRLGTVFVQSDITARHQVDVRQDNCFTVYGVEPGLRVEAAFVQDSSYEDPNEGSYVSLTAVALADGAESAKGGTVEPAGKMTKLRGKNSQQFVLEPASGYDVDSVVVQEAGKAAWTVSREDILAGSFKVTNISADTRVEARFVSVYYTVGIGLTEGGTVRADGKQVADQDQVRVLRGRSLPVVVQPDDAFAVKEIATSGLVFLQQEAAQASDQEQSERAVGNGRAAQAGSGQATRAAGTVTAAALSQQAAERANAGDGALTLRVAGPGALNVAFERQTVTPPTPGTEYFTVTTKSNGHGTISASQGKVAKGSKVQIALTPDAGYRAQSIVIECNGKSTTVSPVQSGYTFTVEGDTAVTATFALINTPGPSNPVLRTLRHLQGLASTGDLNAPGALLLTCIACAALGVALLSTNRRTRRNQDAAHAE